MADGVGCEACHGPAEKWLARHYRDDWKGVSPADKKALGMDNTRDLRARADLCVGCGLCQTRCYAVNKQTKGLLTESAIIIEAGDGKENGA